jgi:hypothetical protein
MVVFTVNALTVLNYVGPIEKNTVANVLPNKEEA